MKPLCFVLDTNIWKSRRYLLLNTPLSKAFLYAIGERKGFIGMPEVLEEEIKLQLAQTSIEQVQRYEKIIATLDDLGIRQVDEPPYDYNQIKKIPLKRLKELKGFLVRVPFTLKHARNALRKVIDSLPPNSPKNQQFKDSAIWEAILELGINYEVYFVTGDKGFFEDRKPDRGLAQNLLEECSNKDLTIKVIYLDEFEKVLSEIRSQVPKLDESKIQEILSNKVIEELRDHLQSKEIMVDIEVYSETTAYLTEIQGVLAISFLFKYKIIDNRQNNLGREGEISVDGSVEYQPTENKIQKLTLSGYSIQWNRKGDIREYEGWVPLSNSNIFPSYDMWIPWDKS
jgi:hypothetical protein